MCGRLTVTAPATAVAEAVGAAVQPAGGDWGPTWNAGPGQALAVVFEAGTGRVMQRRHWGFSLPHGGMVINARLETAAAKPLFRPLLAGHRCLVPASGWFEWERRQDRPQPWYLTRPQQPIMLFAALWQPAADGTPANIIIFTQEAEAAVRHIHDRMPVVVAAEESAVWLKAGPLPWPPPLSPPPPVVAWPVSSKVNNAACNQPDIIVEVPRPPRQLELF